MIGLKMKHFVLKPRSKTTSDPYAKASRIALMAYARSIRDINPKLSHALYCWVNKEYFKELGLVINEKHNTDKREEEEDGR